MKAFTPEQLGVVSQPLDSTEIGQAMMAQRANLTAMIMGGRVMLNIQRFYAVARNEPVHRLPNNGRILPAEYYGEEQ